MQGEQKICLQFASNSEKNDIMVGFLDLPKSHFTDILDKAFHGENNFVNAGNGCILPQSYRDIAEEVKNLKIRDDDVFLCSFPRTGSTWLQEILWLLGNDLNFEKAQTMIQQVYILFIFWIIFEFKSPLEVVDFLKSAIKWRRVTKFFF